MKTFFTKAIFNKEEVPPNGIDWITAHRTTLSIGETEFKIQDKIIKFDRIKTITYTKVPSAFFYPSAILRIETKDSAVSHFGMRYSLYWKQASKLNIIYQTAKIPGIWIRRVIILIVLGYIVYILSR